MLNQPNDREYLGRGLAFPLQFTPRGEIALVSAEQDIEQSLRIILGTMPGERLMRPEFGCRVYELLFEPRDAATDSLLVYYVEQAVERWEPRVEVHEVRVMADAGYDGALIVEIDYQIKATHDERSIVYPFFIANEEEV